MFTDAQWEARRAGLGASELPAILGLSRFASALDVWESKVRGTPRGPESAASEWGHRLEPVIAAKYAEVRGVTLTPGSTVWRDERWFATPDFLVEPGGHLLQIKSTSYSQRKKWELGPPDHVLVQVQWEMFVTCAVRDDVAVLIGGNDYRDYHINRDDRVIARLEQAAELFWQHVLSHTPPDVAALRALWPLEEATTWD